jgi:hypothetical protein
MALLPLRRKCALGIFVTHKLNACDHISIRLIMYMGIHKRDCPNHIHIVNFMP